MTTASNLSLLRALVADDLKRVDAVILKHVESDITLIPQVTQHIIASGGKRLRPALTLLSARACGYTGERHLTLAACVEFIHTATLLHDDVVDESALRRGAATANDVWGNKASVLVGDFLLSRAFQLMVRDGNPEVLRILSDTSAIIAQGEVLQLMASHDPMQAETHYYAIIAAKTGALFAAACEIGPVLASKQEWQADLREFGNSLGIAFQLVDDALDYASTSETLGKAVGDDFRDGKITLPVITALVAGNAEERAFWKRTLEDHDQRAGDLETAISLIRKHRGIQTTLEKAAEYGARCRKLLENLPESPEKAAMLETVDFCLNRAY